MVFEYLASPANHTRLIINRFDIAVALLFLADFGIALTKARSKRQFMYKNWYLLFASIPLVDSWTELLRGLRLLELIRLVRASEHLTFAYSESTTKRRIL